MRRRLLVTTPLALLLAALVALSAGAQPRALWPGVTFDRTVQFTPNGPVVLNVLTGPRPGGTTVLTPLLSNEALTDRETLTAMERRTSAGGALAGVNADFFTFKSGIPSGILMRDGQLASPPSDERSSAGILTDGTLDVRRVTFVGTWQGTGARRTLTRFNRPLSGAGIALYTSAWGPQAPATRGATVATLFPYPAAIPNTDLTAPVVDNRVTSASVPIPPGGAVLVARGASAAALATDAPPTQLVTTRLLFKPDWPNVTTAVGGGPQIVRDGKAVFRAGELFTFSQIGPRSARSAVGQLADGRIVLVSVDGGQPGYSVGVTNFELAQALVRLGAVTAMAFDSGGSTTMAFDGTLLNRPSEPERPIATALAFRYTGVFVQPAVAVVSPDGDGVGDRQSLRYRVVRPSTVTVRLTAPDGSTAYEQTATRTPGSYAVAFPPTGSPPPTPTPPPPTPPPPPTTTPAPPPVTTSPAPTPPPPTTTPAPTTPAPTTSAPSARSTAAARADTPAQGRWKLTVSATDDTGQPSEMSQTFLVNTTVGFLGTAPKKLFLPPYGRDLSVQWRQGSPASVVVTVETREGEVLRTLAKRRYAVGRQSVTWNGLDRGKRAVKGGWYVVHVVAKNALGTVDLTRTLRVQRIVGSKR
jgi:phosphodiester glycosidase